MKIFTPLTKANLSLKIFSLIKIPLIHYCRPKIIEINDQKVVVKIPLKKRTKNHFNSMYFGALAIGADVAGAFMAFYLVKKKKQKISLIFKDFKADFLKRPDDDVYFTCEEGHIISKIIDQTINTGERVDQPVNIVATVPSLSGDEPVAKFVLTISVKVRKSK